MSILSRLAVLLGPGASREGFFRAVVEGDLARTRAILGKKKGFVHIKDHNGYTALHLAALAGHEEIGRFLVAQGADVNARDDDGGTALHHAVVQEHVEMVRVLLAHGADMHARLSREFTRKSIAAAGAGGLGIGDEGATPLEFCETLSLTSPAVAKTMMQVFQEYGAPGPEEGQQATPRER